MSSMEQRIEAFDGEVAETYNYLKDMGAVMPEDKTIENIPTTVQQLVDAHNRIPCTAITIPTANNYEVIDCSNLNWLNTTVFTAHKNAYTKSFIAPYSTTMTSLNGMCQMAALERVDLSPLKDCIIIDAKNIFWNASAIKEVDLSMFDFSSVTSFSRIFENCVALKKVILGHINFNSCSGGYSLENFFRYCTALEYVDMLGSLANNVTSDSFSGSNPGHGPMDVNCPTFVGDKTYNEIKSGNLKIMDGLGESFTANYTIPVGGLSTNIASRLALLQGLADVSSKGLTLKIAMKTSDMSSEDLAIATDKGWSIQSLG